MKSPHPSKLQELKEGIEKIKAIEAELANSKWNEVPSPKSVSDFQNALLERYKAAKSLYVKRRLESFMVDHVTGFDENSGQFEIPDIPSVTNTASGSSTEDEASDANMEEKHEKALRGLETAAKQIEASLFEYRNSYITVVSRRKELERMVQDLEQDDDNDDGESQTDPDEDIMMEDVGVTESDRRKTELLQQKKRDLEEEYARLVKEKEEKLKSISKSREELAYLQKEQMKIVESGQDPTQFHAKIKELNEMKEFYDGLRGVHEELGGIKILHAKEDAKTRHVLLSVLVYDQHKVEFELEIYRETSLKVVNARWISDPFVTSTIGSSNGNGSQDDIFSLPLRPLDDLVQVARTTMGPPHDLRFMVREVCARVRIVQNRCDDIAVLRRRVLTKVVGNDQVVCSLNNGIVVVMRLHDQWVNVEQVVGVNGWDKANTAKIHEAVSKLDESWTPTVVIDLIQEEVERLRVQEGLVLPKTPVLPIRRKKS